MGFWFQQIFVLNIEERRKDFQIMLAHHIVTCLLLTFSYGMSYTRIGNTVLVIMDFADIWLSMAKCMRYLKLEKPAVFVFGFFVLSWIYTRHYLFGIVIWSTYKESFEILPADSWDPEKYSFFTTNIIRGFLLLFGLLQLLLLYWLYLILRIIYNVVFAWDLDDTRSDTDAIPSNVPTIPADRVFSIEGRGLKLTTAQDVQEWVDAIRNFDNLEEIRLNGNTIGAEAAEALGAALKEKTTLKVARLHDIFTGRLREEVGKATKILGDSLKDHKELLLLDLSDNAFGPTGADAVYDFLANSSSLQTLYLNNNGLGIQGGKTIAKALMERHEKNVKEGKQSSLRCIVAGRNRLENGSSKELSDLFAAIGTLTEVQIPQNGIRPEGIAILMEGLAKNPDLRILNLQDNTFTEPGSLALAKALNQWNQLDHLNIGDSLLGAKGGRSVIEALDKKSTITHLNLQYNEIEADGAAALAEILPSLVNLKTLELNGNRFDAESDVVERIKAALSENDIDDCLGSLSDMEELTDDEDDDSDDEQIQQTTTTAAPVKNNLSLDKEAKKEVKANVQDLIDQMEKRFGLN
ncbi:Ran GAP Rna1 [Mycoemilia scoparia]|uniref:Ran GAP Rna1 n=1 Tax=Mycoemilia scoparia TaxID=417184 RepID=A0A9W7ZXQ8_9FUNG|nr:Ran GAP Rna1 [Mycoemilia scoparia]